MDIKRFPGLDGPAPGDDTWLPDDNFNDPFSDISQTTSDGNDDSFIPGTTITHHDAEGKESSLESFFSSLGSSGSDFSPAEYMQNHPGMSYEEYLAEFAKHSDEWAEKYLDYLTNKGELDRANEYTANREDTAYQRLINDLKAAGLNPALLYGSTASISPGGSQSYFKASEGANSRSISNQKKIADLLLAYLMYELKKSLGTANTVIKGFGSIFSLFN